MGSTTDASSNGITTYPSIMGVAHPCRRVSLTSVATICESCSHETRPLAVSITGGREGRRCSSDSSMLESIIVLCVLTIIAFCPFPTNDTNLIVLLRATASPLSPFLPTAPPASRPNLRSYASTHISERRRSRVDPFDGQVNAGLKVELVGARRKDKRIERTRKRRKAFVCERKQYLHPALI